MRLRQIALCFFLFGALQGIPPAMAQYSADYQTNVISGITNYWSGNYYVGSNTFANGLMIRNGGVLANADAQVGCLSMSTSNYVLVSGAGSVWSNANMYLGNLGGANTLVVSNAGRVQNDQLTYIGNTGASIGNRVLITGTNSTLTSPYDLRVGYAGSSNTIVITNGGRLVDATGYVGDDYGSSGNTVLVTGATSAWTNNGHILVGNHGYNNNLSVSKGARLYSTYATVGLWDTATANSIVISDSDSLWDNSAVASDIVFGLLGSGNNLLVTNGGQVLGYYAYFGRLSSGYNSALITGPGSSFSVNCYIYTGYQGHDNSFTAANGATISDKFCYISWDTPSMNNSVLITGTNTSWQNSYSVFVGFSGVGGGLTVSNGATLGVTEHGVLGNNASSMNNHAVVTGGGSVWSCIQNMWVGTDGPSNSLGILNGGKVNNTHGLIGYSITSTGNSTLVAGTNSLWNNSGNVYVGYDGPGNSLVITNGGWVKDSQGFIGYNYHGSNNVSVVTGAGSVWSNSTAILIGNRCSSNSLAIRNGGLVVSGQWGLIGEESTSSNNAVVVESGGIWRNQSVAVGDDGSHNSLTVNGGLVYATNLVVGYNSADCDNIVQLNSGEINVTNSTGGAVLEVYRGTFVMTGGTLRVNKLIVTNDCARFKRLGGTLTYGSLQLNPAFDADGDGIPNGWEQAHGMDPLNPLDAQADPDNDKMNNLQEYLAGTNPTNSASYLRITSQVVTGKNVRVSWSAVGGKSYVLQASGSPNGGYTDVSPVITMPGTSETVTNYLHLGAVTNWPARYYRVRLGP
jgi:T5SS/PEP-CTERM-associated repeat protein